MSETAPKAIRSPSYPSMSLRDSVAAIAKIEQLYRSNAIDRESAAKLIGYSSLSGPAAKALAALSSYGLLERAGKGEARVTARARAILHAQDEGERIQNLLDAASEPPLFLELRERFAGIAVPPESGIVTHLNRQGFNPSAVRPAASAFLETMRFVEELKATESHGAGRIDDVKPATPDLGNNARFGGAKVGDFIQWESKGALQLPRPLRVRFISEDGEWVAVEGSQTGIPMSQVLVESSEPKTVQPPVFRFDDEPAPTAMKGETDWIRFRVGPETNVRLLVSGDFGPREIGRLIKLLEAQRVALEDDDLL